MKWWSGSTALDKPVKEMNNNAAILLTFIIKTSLSKVGFLFEVKECLITLQNKHSNRFVKSLFNNVIFHFLSIFIVVERGVFLIFVFCFLFFVYVLFMSAVK